MAPQRNSGLEKQLPHYSSLSADYTNQFGIPQQWCTIPQAMLGRPMHFGTGHKQGRASGADRVKERIKESMSIEDLEELHREAHQLDLKKVEDKNFCRRYIYDPSEKYQTIAEAEREVFGDEEESCPELPPDFPHTHAHLAFAPARVFYPETCLQPPSPSIHAVLPLDMPTNAPADNTSAYATADLSDHASPTDKDRTKSPLPQATESEVPLYFPHAAAFTKLTADGQPWRGYTDATEAGQQRFVACDPADNCREYYGYRLRKEEEDRKAREGEGRWWDRMLDKAEGRGSGSDAWWLTRG